MKVIVLFDNFLRCHFFIVLLIKITWPDTIKWYYFLCKHKM